MGASSTANSTQRVLKREHIVEIQRGRMLAATVALAAESGANKLSVASIVARSGVSRRTFYEIFTNNQDCLLAALEDSLAWARTSVREVYNPQQPWRTRIRSALHALLCFLEDEPARARLLIVEAPGVGPRALERRAHVLEELIEAIAAGSADSARGAALTPLTAEGLVGSVLAVLRARLLASTSPELVELTNPLMSMIVLPYLGPAAARRELELALPKHEPCQEQAGDGAGLLTELPMRLTYRTMRVLNAIAAQPRISNRQISVAADISDQGQVSKMLQRLERLGLIANARTSRERGLANAWQLTPMGAEIERTTGRAWERTTQTRGREAAP